MATTVKVYGVYAKDGHLVDLADWTNGEFAAELATRLGGTLRSFDVAPFDWRPRIPRVL